MISQDEILRLNRKVDIPCLLTFIGAPIQNLKELRPHLDYRINCWFRDGDNNTGLGISFYPEQMKWRFTDFTKRTFSNIDLVDFLVKVINIPFRKAIDTIVFCSGKNNALAEDISVEQLQGQCKPKLEHPVPIDNNILNTFEQGLHSFWKGRNYDHEVASRFELGFCNYGILKNRLTIPIRDEKGQLVGVQGRVLNEEDEPKYLFADSEQGQSSKLILYNFPSAIKEAQQRGWLGVVEGAADCWRAYQYGYKNFIATLSTSVTDRQFKLLSYMRMNIVIFPDIDVEMAGQYSALKLANRLYEKGINVWIVNPRVYGDPSSLTKEQFTMSLKNATQFKGG